jgi:hypothetical protein
MLKNPSLPEPLRTIRQQAGFKRTGRTPQRVLKRSNATGGPVEPSPRLLKKVQMQGGVRQAE